jgi:hypothetical protein
LNGGKIGWKRDSLSRQRKIKEEESQRRDHPPHKRVVHNPTMYHHLAGFLLRQVITEGHKCKHGGGAPVPPQNYVVPNVTFEEPYAQYPQPQQNMAIIGGYVVRNKQNVAAIQSNAAQLSEDNANIAYELGRLHLVQPDQFVGGDVQPYYEQG